MQHYIIKFQDGYYFGFIGDQRVKTKDLNKAFVYMPYDLAVEKLNSMKKYNPLMKDCYIVDKYEEMKLYKNN
ncbi:MAG: hypothetical protein Q8880_13500 [Bacteroidota bacterium]|nr:hypothetical protein [Bacteroidota bacterium]